MNRNAIGMLLACLVFIFSTSQVSAIAIDFFPSDTTVYAGDSFDVDVVVSGLTAANEIVSGFDLFVGYDSNKLTATSVTFGSYLGPDTFFQIVDLSLSGQIEIYDVAAFTDDADLIALQNDSFTLFTLSFNTLMEGVSDLLFNPSSNVVGKNALSISVTAGTGTVTVLAPIVAVAEPNSIILFVTAFVLMSLISFRGSVANNE